MEKHRSISLLDCIFVTGIILVGLALLMPALQQSRADDRLNRCTNNARSLTLATLNKESATQRFPLAMFGKGAADSIDTQAPTPFAGDDGYSWIAALLPYLNQTKLYDDLVEQSEFFQLNMNSSQMKTNGRWTHNTKVEELLCPSTPEERTIARGKYPGLTDGQVSNYLALTAACVEPGSKRFADVSPATGGMIVTKRVSPKGLKIRECKDGTSKTILFGESKAENYAYWYSGRSTSTVATVPSAVTTKEIVRGNDGFASVPEGQPSSIGYGTDRSASNDDGKVKWFAKEYPPGPQDWSISSHHAEGVVHAYVDGHVKVIKREIDPTGYFRMVTRGGGEPTPIDGDFYYTPPPTSKPTSGKSKREPDLETRVEKLEKEIAAMKRFLLKMRKEIRQQ